MICYKIHSLVEVRVGEAVRSHVRDSIEFQIGHFKTQEASSDGAAAFIRYEPYDRFQGADATEFHMVRGQSGRVLHAPDSRFAIVVNGSGFDVFTDTSEVLVNILIQVIALRRGMTFMHAAGWVDGLGRVTLAPGPGGVGKTALLSAGIMRHKARLLGDDLVLVGVGAKALSFPRAFVLKPYHRSQYPDHYPNAVSARRSCVAPVARFLKANMPFRGLIKDALRRVGRLEPAAVWLNHGFTGDEIYPVPVEKLFGAKCVAEGGEVDRVVYLERWDGSEFIKMAMTTRAVVARGMAVLQHEWVEYGRWFSQLGALELISMPDYFRALECAMTAACNRAEKWLVQVPASTTPEELESWFARNVGFDSMPG